MNLYYFGQALELSSVYMIGGLGSLYAIKNGNFNLGGEGQIYVGGFLCAILLDAMKSLPPIVAIPLTFVLVFSSGALIALLSSILKNIKNADTLFTSFIISCAIIPLINGAIAGNFRTKEGNLLATSFIQNKFRFKSILEPSPLNGFIFISILLCVLTYLFFNYTGFGRRICIKGISEKFSDYCGYKTKNITNFSFVISGGLLAIGGALTVCGTFYTCHSGFYAGLGWNSLSTALLANGNPLLLIPAALFMAFIDTYSNKYALLMNLGFNLSSLLQGIILFLISFQILKTKDIRFFNREAK